jgi:predicted dehydrogenase
MNRGMNRREFLKQTTAAGVGLWATGLGSTVRAQSPNERLNLGVIGVGGRGAANLRGVRTENIVALCDVDDEMLARAAMNFPMAAKYQDFRKMLERRDLDAVVVSTPDHCHAFAAVMAMEQGRHVYCEKPLTHSPYEARLMAATAYRKKVATQMGNQGHSSASTRRIVELLESNVIGPVREIHAWTNRPIWPQGIDRPADSPPVPSTLQWDLWLGPAPERPYNPAYHPFKWRGWWDFGTGALGDMACHVLDAAFWGLRLGAPTTVEAEGPPVHPETAPPWMIVRYEFPARGDMPPVKLTWYDGGKLPPAELVDGQRVERNGTLYIGDKGKLYVPDEYNGRFRLLPESSFSGFTPPEPWIPPSVGHYPEWIAACKGGSPAGSNFGFAGPLTETVLLGIAAYRVGKKITWNPMTMEAVGCPEAKPFIQREYRKGWSLTG